MSSVLQVENINVYYGSIHAVKDVSFHVEQGEVVTLIGANGAGKSTTLNTVAGLLRSRTGSVRFMDEELRHVPSHKLVGRGMALVPEGRRIFQHMTVQENLDMGGYCRGGDLNADIDMLQIYYSNYIDNERAGVVRATQKNKRPLKTFRQRIKVGARM